MRSSKPMLSTFNFFNNSEHKISVAAWVSYFVARVFNMFGPISWKKTWNLDYIPNIFGYLKFGSLSRISDTSSITASSLAGPTTFLLSSPFTTSWRCRTWNPGWSTKQVFLKTCYSLCDMACLWFHVYESKTICPTGIWSTLTQSMSRDF